MNVYRPLTASIITSQHKPSHRQQVLKLFNSFDVYNSDTMAGVLTLGILILVVAPFIRYYPLFFLWPLLYVVYLTVRLLITRNLHQREWVGQSASSLVPVAVRDRIRTLVPSSLLSRAFRKMSAIGQLPAGEILRRIQLFFSLMLTFGALVFCLNVMHTATVLRLPLRDSDTVWLLFAIPILRAARYGSRIWFVGMAGLAIACNALVLLTSESLSALHAVRIIGIQSAWLLLIGSLPSVLSRYLAERQAGMGAAVLVGSEIARLRTPSQQEFADQACTIIAKAFGYDEVNILVPTSDDDAVGKGLRFLGASSEAGGLLVQSGYTLDQAKGITGCTAVHKREHLVNDVRKDTKHLYFFHPSFRDTLAEFAIPLLLSDKLLGVLDVQSTHAYAFTEDDVETLRAIVPHLAVALDNAQNLAHAKGLYNISQSIARRLLSHYELRSVLQEVVKVAREVLGADNVVLYPRNPRAGTFDDALFAGDLRTYVSSGSAVMDPRRQSAALRSIQLDTPQFINHVSTSGMFRTDRRIGSLSAQSFIEREAISSSAVLPLRMGSDPSEADAHAVSLGVIFVNYRKERLFTDEYKDWCIALSDLAALAIQSAQLYQRVANEERANMWREIHDGMAQYAGLTRMMLEQLGSNFEREGGIDGDKLLTARDLSQALQRQVNYLIEIWRDHDPGNLMRRAGVVVLPRDTRTFFGEIEDYANIVHTSLEVECACTFEGQDNLIPLTLQHDARMIFREAVHNAVRHGHATSITLHAGVTFETLTLGVRDNGRGFDAERVASARGLDNMRYRAARRGGTVEIHSSIDHGTEVSVTIPLRTTDNWGPVPDSIQPDAIL